MIIVMVGQLACIMFLNRHQQLTGIDVTDPLPTWRFGHAMFYHDPEVMGSNPAQVEPGVSDPSLVRKNIKCGSAL